jgi:transposase
VNSRINTDDRRYIPKKHQWQRIAALSCVDPTNRIYRGLEEDMPKPLSIDLRERVARACTEKKSTQEEIAKRFAVGSASVKRIWRLWREKQNVAPRPHGGGTPRKIDSEGEKKVEELVREKPDRTTQELTDTYNKTAKICVSRPSMGRALMRQRLTYKKNGISIAEKGGAC